MPLPRTITHIELDTPATSTFQWRCERIQILTPERVELLNAQRTRCIVTWMKKEMYLIYCIY